MGCQCPSLWSCYALANYEKLFWVINLWKELKIERTQQGLNNNHCVYKKKAWELPVAQHLVRNCSEGCSTFLVAWLTLFTKENEKRRNLTLFAWYSFSYCISGSGKRRWKNINSVASLCQRDLKPPRPWKLSRPSLRDSVMRRVVFLVKLQCSEYMYQAY